MTPEQFTYWMQGFAELHPEPPTLEQWQSIREHLATVFKKVTPPVQAPAPNLQDFVERYKRNPYDLSAKCAADVPMVPGHTYC